MKPAKRPSPLIVFAACFAVFQPCSPVLSAVSPVWSELPSLPDSLGVAGPFAGVSGDALIVAGGANFPKGPPWDGGAKVWHDRVFALSDPEGQWRSIGQLPHPLGYGISITWEDRLVCIGGSDQNRHYAEVFALHWNGAQLETVAWPALPEPLANAAGVVHEASIYVAGGSTNPGSARAPSRVWRLDLSGKIANNRWVELPSWPGPERILPVMASQNGRVLLVSGARLLPDGNGGVTRQFLQDAFAFDPRTDTWSSITGPPAPMAAAPNPGIPLGYADVLFLSGDDGENFFRQTELQDKHPGFPAALYRYNTITDRWTEAGQFPHDPPDPAVSRIGAETLPPVTTPIVAWRGQHLIASGEVRPAVRTPKVMAVKFTPTASGFGGLNWFVLAVYLSLLVAIGFGCSRRESSTETYFLGGRKVPWWAAGLSLFSTLLSAITYLALPARAYATDWTMLLVNLCVLAVAPLIIFKYLPVLRGSNVTTVYEYLALRFDGSVQKFGSASFILFQTGRMGIVLLLPALALSAVTGINVYLCIILMGLLATLYTVLGGIEAVIWTDVLQTVVLLGGAVTVLAIICRRLEGGLADLFHIGGAAGKFHWANLDTSLVSDSVVVILLGGLFSNALVPYSSDQAVVQRYLTTPDAATARRSLWLGAIMVLPATLLFLMLGTGLFVFFREHPAALAPLEKADQILPWFIANLMPDGLAGLVIAGVFAAAMSSLDSSMHSIATSIVTDWWKPSSGRPQDESKWLRRARQITLVAGLFGTLTALLLAGIDIRFLWDFFLGLLGLVGGTLAGIMAVGVFVPSARSRHVWAGIGVGVAVLVYVKFFTPLNSLLLGFVGVASVMLVAALTSIPGRTRCGAG